MLQVLLTLLCFYGALASRQYKVGIRDSEGVVHNWGSLDLLGESLANTAKFAPSELEVPPSAGCIGIINGDEFECQTLFRDIPESRAALRVVVDPTGAVTQLQLVDGHRTQLSIDVPAPVPKPELKKAPSAAGSKGGEKKKLNEQWKERKAQQKSKDVEDDVEEEEKSFIEKYWTYLIPIVIVIVFNSFGGGAAAAANRT